MSEQEGVPVRKVIWYRCDPEKNVRCRKTICKGFCGRKNGCFRTKHPEYAQLDEKGEPIVDSVQYREVREMAKEEYEKCLVNIKPQGAALIMAIESGLIKKHRNGMYQIRAFNLFWMRVENEIINSVAEKVCKVLEKILRTSKAGEKPADEQTDPELSVGPAAGMPLRTD